MDFEERENRSTRRKTCSPEQGREPTTDSTYIWCPCRIFAHETHSAVGGECSHHRANPCSPSLGWATPLSWTQLVEEKKPPLTRNRVSIQLKKFNDTIQTKNWSFNVNQFSVEQIRKTGLVQCLNFSSFTVYLTDSTVINQEKNVFKSCNPCTE